MMRGYLNFYRKILKGKQTLRSAVQHYICSMLKASLLPYKAQFSMESVIDRGRTYHTQVEDGRHVGRR
jgi:hypothetical protein